MAVGTDPSGRASIGRNRQKSTASLLLDEVANLVCQQQISMLGFPAQFDRIFRVTHDSLKRQQVAVLTPFAAHRRFDQP